MISEIVKIILRIHRRLKYGKSFTVKQVVTHLDTMKSKYPDKLVDIERLQRYFANREWEDGQ